MNLIIPVPNPYKESDIIFFDGVCNLCNGFVQFVIKNSASQKFKFASLQGHSAQQILSINSDTHFSTILFLEHGIIYKKSSAVLRIAKKLDHPWKIFFAFIIIPQFLRDFVYDFVAKNRYRFFGKTVVCRIPTEDEKHLFLD